MPTFSYTYGNAAYEYWRSTTSTSSSTTNNYGHGYDCSGYTMWSTKNDAVHEFIKEWLKQNVEKEISEDELLALFKDDD